ncbi:FlaG/FlaF family flagellin (archaellin) [Methanomicrobium sp. W14]|uniref:type IV pilin N-terminal domain-containing protein n=1 Tax=Methanomicrobium sp. W14 TaxID=2817839 RepID=UPI001AE5FDE9|nr:type IV pilin N-terminal domain-containing protein [Methanomicrobium sp. W14]MBP2134048.1 FlaG/FlaF family flagellin (archaellin) [Methanomicrobium sp. W14]
MAYKSNDNAVSPVVGVMLMLVVTIIIAAVVSAFSGGLTSGQTKAPQANIKGTFSISEGMTISHAGGDSLATKDIIFTIRDGSTFGPNLESSTAQTLDMTTIKVNTPDRGEGPMRTIDGAFYMTSFNSGDTVTIDPEDCTCNIMQPNVAPTDFEENVGEDNYTYKGNQTASWAYCIRNQDSIGKKFILEVSDTGGHLISKTDVLVTA